MVVAVFIASAFSRLPLFSLQRRCLVARGGRNIECSVTHLPRARQGGQYIGCLRLARKVAFASNVNIPGIRTCGNAISFSVMSCGSEQGTASSGGPTVRFFVSSCGCGPVLGGMRGAAEVLMRVSYVIFTISFSLCIGIPRRIGVRGVCLGHLFTTC